MTQRHTLTIQTGRNIVTIMKVLDTRSLAAGEFRTQCLDLMDKTVAKLIPAPPDDALNAEA